MSLCHAMKKIGEEETTDPVDEEVVVIQDLQNVSSQHAPNINFCSNSNGSSITMIAVLSWSSILLSVTCFSRSEEEVGLALHGRGFSPVW
jgi:hypothetical protein